MVFPISMSRLLWLTVVAIIVFISTINPVHAQGNHITAYLVGNSHDDVGWQMTIDGYYEWHIRSMFDTTVAMLSVDPQRKFIYCEVAFFSKWWADNRTAPASRTNFTNLVKNKQVEFGIGGWVMNDEGNPSYSSIIDQLTEGHQFLKDNFGIVPQYTWQIDPSGLTSAMPTIALYAGMKGHLIDRIDYQLKQKLTLNRHLEFMWQGSPSLTTKSQIFTHILHDLYCTPYSTFNWNDDNTVNATNVKTWADNMVAHIKKRQEGYLHTHVLVPWVCDFAFNNAQPMFLNMDRIIEYIQQHSSTYNVTLKYALLSEYFEAVQATNVSFPEYLYEDFLPYYVQPNGWRTGFYTSRPEFKGLVREKESTLRSVDSIFAMSSINNFHNGNISFDTLEPLRHAVAEVQHHDAVVGTMRELVLASYIKDLSDGAEIALQTSAHAIQLLLGGSNENKAETLVAGTTPLLNLQKGMTGVLNAFNSLGWNRKDFIKLSINIATVIVTDSYGNTVPSQVLPALEHNAQGRYNLFFEASLPALGYSTFFVVVGGVFENYIRKASDTILKNDYYQLTVSNATGRISQIQNLMTETAISIDQNFLTYQSYEGTAMQKSDPYYMSVAGPALVLSKSPPKSKVSVGPLVQELYQEFSSNESSTSFAKQIVRLYHSSSSDIASFIEVYHEIGVLPANRELITQFSTNIASGEVWFTDENGYEEMKRVRNTQADQPIPANYYPGVYSTRIADGIAQLTVLSERTHSVSSQSTGTLQVMLHRRITTCPCEISEPLNDTTITTPILRLIVDSPKYSPILLHKQSYLLNFPLLFHSGLSSLTPAAWLKAHNGSRYSAMSGELPANVHLLSFKALNRSTNQYILRLTHIFATGEDENYSSLATIDVGKLFSTFKIKSFQQTSLTANQAFKEVPLVVQLLPKEIKTFLIAFAN